MGELLVEIMRPRREMPLYCRQPDRREDPDQLPFGAATTRMKIAEAIDTIDNGAS